MKSLRLLPAFLYVLLAAGPALAGDPVRVTNDGYLNYMPSLLSCDDGRLLVVYERLDASFENGDLMATFSDDGLAWSTPEVVTAGAGNERHPSVVQRGDGSYLVFYLSDETGGYKIHHALSEGGAAWSPLGAVDLGWTTEQLVNPTVCEDPDGSFTMAYDRLSVGGYVAHSADGLAWDHLKTEVSGGSLNRIMRHSGGTYVLSYQRKTGLYYYQIDIFTKTSADRLSWSGENRVTTNQNSHDSFPIELAGGTCALYYAKSTGGQPYDLMRRFSADGSAWGAEEPVLPYAGWDTEPHPILAGGAAACMAWPRGAEQNTTDVYFVFFDDATGVRRGGGEASRRLRPSAAPNPFREGVEIRFGSPASGGRAVTVHDVAGRLVATLTGGATGVPLVWDGIDDAGRSAPPGVYFARVEGGSETVRLVRVR